MTKRAPRAVEQEPQAAPEAAPEAAQSAPEVEPVKAEEAPAAAAPAAVPLVRAVAIYGFGPAVGQIVEAEQEVIDSLAAAGNVDPHPEAVAHAEAAGALTTRI